MKRMLLTLLAVILVAGLFAAAGYTGYRVGYVQGVQESTSSDAPQLRPFDGFGRDEMPGREFGFERGFPREFGRSPRMGFGFFSPWAWIGRLAVLALLIGFAYWLFTRSGWRLRRETPTSVPKTHEEQAP